MSLFGLKQVENLATPRNRGHRKGQAAKAMDSITNTVVAQFGETLRSAFHTIDNVQRGIVGISFAAFLPLVRNLPHQSNEHTDTDWEHGEGDEGNRGRRSHRAHRNDPISAAELFDPRGTH